MNIRDMEYIVAVADLNSFSGAASACHVSQPSLSAQIKKVEEELGMKIFERTKRTVTLSAFGHAFVPRARKIIEEVEKIRSDAKAHANPFFGHISIGAIATVAPYLFPAILQTIRSDAPDLNISLRESVTGDLLKGLLSGDIDMAILSLPTDTHVLEEFSLFEDPFYLAVAKGSPLAEMPFVGEELLRNMKLILLEEEHCLRQQALSICKGGLMQEDRSFRATSLETIRHIVATGQGVTLMPQLARQENDGITYIPIQSRNFSRTIGLVWRKTDERAPFYKIFASMISKK
ncbi:MAG: DNA-binding transcriptional regulator OxyR [Micavibrio aeruginosavorus]|uniref:DNA-binding transcriptional regulator OxyR n=1 Tax=Micavibrio aeruginosavorus TaxID=349221 RepID=A0A2W5FHF1_9BACT|nr:MAG: DNA-binding transcriptional regulator OxyR [Micavibrio aeruginosavorus]